MSSVVLAGEPCLATRVDGNLWMGGAPPIGAPVGHHFDALILCACEYQIPWCFPGVVTLAVNLNDDGSPMRRQEAFDAVEAAKKVISMEEAGLRILVTCRQGRNRSGLVTALALCHGQRRWPAERAIRAVRASRGPMALSNDDFVALIRRLDVKRR